MGLFVHAKPTIVRLLLLIILVLPNVHFYAFYPYFSFGVNYFLGTASLSSLVRVPHLTAVWMMTGLSNCHDFDLDRLLLLAIAP